jgi:hypothetical protein
VPESRVLVVRDLLTARGRHDVEMMFHLGPEVTALLDGDHALLTWSGHGAAQYATLSLPGELVWSAYRGETDPPLGWYSPSFGRRVPSTTLVGVGTVQGTLELGTELRFRDVASPTLPRRELGR